MSVCCDGLCCVCAFVRHWAITGTLDPVRNLTGLTRLYLGLNSIGGMFVRAAVGIAAVLVAFGVWMAVAWGITATQTRDIALVNHIAGWFCLDG